MADMSVLAVEIKKKSGNILRDVPRGEVYNMEIYPVNKATVGHK